MSGAPIGQSFRQMRLVLVHQFGIMRPPSMAIVPAMINMGEQIILIEPRIARGTFFVAAHFPVTIDMVSNPMKPERCDVICNLVKIELKRFVPLPLKERCEAALAHATGNEEDGKE